MKIDKIGLGGGCHWCTEAVFQSLKGVNMVEQGWISALEAEEFSEAILLYFDPEEISLKKLIEVHLYTHKSTSDHSMRKKYRSAVYTFSGRQQKEADQILRRLQKDFQDMLITGIYSYKDFKMSPEPFQNYYLKNPNKPFCKTYIGPKLQMLLRRFPKNAIEPPLIPHKTVEE
ncbi:peptide-methionine (S)-S-oxide reductase [uncultured Eudoraea sp.]|uniref:peptide-methionine (S)-S-oxide reductase n=1 Tax=uncultured Eudoraea sp. TaxID=1035614 RepID=UPI0026119233|nr:peptide-methionine (S)-S-oxide reductase [uncultured Eudoraea sp.]